MAQYVYYSVHRHTLDMTHTIKHTKRILTTVILLLAVATFIHAQTVVEVVNDTENSVVFRIENIDVKESPQKIVLVYDSNLITLESTSIKTRFMQSSEFLNTSSSYSAPAAMASTLAVEFEKEQELEEWMLQPFQPTASNTSNRADKEPEMNIESWMYDLDSWSN